MIEDSNLDKLRAMVKKSAGQPVYESWIKQASLDDDKHKVQFHKLYEGYGPFGKSYDFVYARFHMTEGVKLVRNVTEFNKDGTITSNTQSIAIGPEEVEEFIFAYLTWEERNKYGN